MLGNDTMQKLWTLRLPGMAKALEELRGSAKAAAIGLEEGLALMVDREDVDRKNRATAKRIGVAKLREKAMIEDIDWQHRRGLDKGTVLALAGCDWIRRGQHVILVGATGLGKTWLACALAHRACLEGLSVRFYRLPRLLDDLAAARAAGTKPRMIDNLTRVNLLVVDDWGQGLTEQERRDIREIIADRDGRGSLIITTQLPVDRWHEVIGDPTIADAILDRIVSKAHRITLSGDSLRKKRVGEEHPA